MRNMFVFSAALVGVAAMASPASAHAHLVRAVPAAGSTVKTSPTELRLKFSEGLELGFSGVSVAGAGKAPVAVGTPTLDPADPTVMIVPLSGALKAGHYDVEWHATATDTHKTKGHYGFTVAP